jgi:hypothetical protein
MTGNDLSRRVTDQRAEARSQARAALMGRAQSAPASATAADCARAARDPLRRLEPMRRRTASADKT